MILLSILIEFIKTPLKLHKNEKKYKESFFNANGDLEVYSIFKYNEYGNIVEVLTYNIKNDDQGKTIYEYDKKQRLLSLSISNLKHVEHYRYNNKNKLIEKYLSKGDMNFGFTSYEYNSKGNIIKEISYNNDKKTILGYIIFEFDKNQNLIKKSEFGNNDMLSNYTIYEYEIIP